MVEMSIWVPVLLLQACLLTGSILGFFLWRAQKIRRRLQGEVDELHKSLQEKTWGTEVEAPETSQDLPEHVGGPEVKATGNAEGDLPEAVPDANLTDKPVDVDTVLQIPEMMHGMILQLQEKHGLLQKHVQSLHELSTLAAEDKQKLQTLSALLRETEEELQALRKSNLQLKGNLQEKKWHMRVKDDSLEAIVQGYSRLERANRTLRMTNAGLKLENEAKKKMLAEYDKKMAQHQEVLTENFELKQQVNISSHSATAEQELRFLKQELWEVKNKLVQRETELRSVQEQYEEISSEYQRLFTCLRT